MLHVWIPLGQTSCEYVCMCTDSLFKMGFLFLVVVTKSGGGKLTERVYSYLPFITIHSNLTGLSALSKLGDIYVSLFT